MPYKEKAAVSTTSHTIGDLSLSLETKCKRHYEADSLYILTYTVKLSGSTDVIVTAEGLVISRDAIASPQRWYSEMDLDSDETAQFATKLFDSRARLYNDLVTNSKRKGTGVWGHELDKGAILYIKSVTVEEAYHRRGLATWLISHILSNPSVQLRRSEPLMSPLPSLQLTPSAMLELYEAVNGPGSYAMRDNLACPFAFAWPTCLFPGSCTQEEREQGDAAAVQTFRKAGFRRVGNTQFFAYALCDSTHPSRQLRAEDDCDDGPSWKAPAAGPPPPPVPAVLAAATQALDERLDPSVAKTFPLHAAIVCQTEDEVLGLLARLKADGESAYIRTRDTLGCTPLHIAATGARPRVIAELLTMGTPDDLNTEDNEGRTPLQSLEKRMRGDRAFMQAMGISFKGYDENTIRAKVALLQAAGAPVPNADALKWGCTCGDCLGGWFSPVMRYRVHVTAIVAGDIVPDSMMYTSTPRKPLGDMVDMVYLSEYIPEAIRGRGIYASYIHGYAEMFKAVAHVVERGELPRPQAVLLEVTSNPQMYDTRYVSHYLEKGGRPEHVLDAVLSRAYEEGPAGEDEFDEVHGEGLEGLPQCENDEDYDIIRHNLGIPADHSRPTIGFPGRFDMDDDSDDEEDDDEYM